MPITYTNIKQLNIYRTLVLGCFLGVCNLISAQQFQNSNVQKSAPPAQPNILVIMLDDARYDFCEPNGGPAFFQSPSINRIAYEGVNFKNSFVIESICGPSRATVYTGLYPQNNGVDSNFGDTICCGLPTVATILKSSGYYTGMIGKYGLQSAPQPGYDYWCVSNTVPYFNSQFNINGIKVTLPDHKTDIITLKTLEFLQNRPVNQPFLLFMNHKAPHKPLTPRPVDIGLFDNDTMPLPDNFYRYTQNFPDYIYKFHLQNPDTITGITDTTLDRIEQTRLTYELFAGVESSVTQVLNYLDSTGITDSTLIIFMSDNGYLQGDHFLMAKELPYEESMRIPIFVRYPNWFPAGSVVTNEFALNLDIAPTILDAAGIPNTYNMPGFSLRNLYNQTSHRNEFIFQFNSKSTEPYLRAVRSVDYKYIKNFCVDSVEEFFDLVNDPAENINRISDPFYAPLVQLYRQKLDSFMLVLNDTLVDSVMNCVLINPVVINYTEMDDYSDEYEVFPNPANDFVKIKLANHFTETISYSIYNMLGEKLYSAEETKKTISYETQIPLNFLKPGIYQLIINSNDKIEAFRLLIVH